MRLAPGGGSLSVFGAALVFWCAAWPAACPVPSAHATETAPSLAQSLPEAWRALGLRLEADMAYGADIDAIFRALEPPSPDPMGRKIRELYRIHFPPPPPPPPPPGTARPQKKPPVHVYPHVVTPENAAECRTFITLNETAFARAEERFHVPRSIAAALLFVETRLGRSPGKHKVFHTLASMASSRDPDQLGPWLEKLDHPESRLEWIGETMRKRSDWAYKELSAFLAYARANNIDPLTVPGSIYGAMGMCQFMPSNISLFAADGDGDGVIDLFRVDDAVTSLSNYLILNGWKPGADRRVQFAALRRYNHQDIYANTILCLADLVRGEAVGRPILPAGKKAPGQKAPGKKPAGKKTPAPKASVQTASVQTASVQTASVQTAPAPKTPAPKTPARTAGKSAPASKAPGQKTPNKTARP